MVEPTTFRLHDRRKFRRALSRLELEYDELWEADAADIHTAIVWVAIENPNLLTSKVNEITQNDME